MASYFINRPIFAAVISILITLAGALAVFSLPISQYPPITPPTIQVDCNYPGASSKVVSETIAAPIEQRVNGVEGMLYMTSQSTSDGSYTLTIAFEVGTNLDLAQIRVQNRVNLALPELPDVVRATGVTTRKRSPEILLTVSINSPIRSQLLKGIGNWLAFQFSNPTPHSNVIPTIVLSDLLEMISVHKPHFEQLYMSNYATLQVKDRLSRIPGISDVTIFGQRDYSLRVWINPGQLAARNLTAIEVVNAIRGQNNPVALGYLGGQIDTDSPTVIPLKMIGRLTTEEDFANIVLKTGADGQLVRVKDVARVELEAKSFDVSNRFDNYPTIGLAIFTLPDANALDTAEAVKAAMADMAKDFPDGMRYQIGYDTTPFMKESIREVFKALRDSIILVAIVVIVFLQTWRAALIPLLAVPVAIVGTFAAMWVVGFGLNNLTLFGLVLAVGIVVDDAIVVVEAVQHQLELGHAPREATLRAMKEVTGPIIAVGAVLVAVFLPCAFFSGIVGLFFRQFALTIAISTIISTINSLSMSPALAAILLRSPKDRPDLLTRVMNIFLGWFFRLFDRMFRYATWGYVRTVSGLIRIPLLVAFVYGGLLVLTWFGYLKLPAGFIPQQDKGFLIASIQLPDAASAERTREAIRLISEEALKTPGVAHVNAVAGNSFVLSAYGSNFGSMFIILKSFDERRDDPALYSEVIAANLRNRIGAKVPNAVVNIFGASAVPGLGRAGGFRLMVQDRNDSGPRALQEQTEELIKQANKQPGLVGLFTVFKTDSPQVFVKVDTAACLAQGIAVNDVYATLQASMGARYVNDFNRFGRTWQVNVQAEQKFRNSANDVGRLLVKNKQNQLVPLSAVAEIKEVIGPLVLTRYNSYPAAAINGNVAPGVSSAYVASVLEQLAQRDLPEGMTAQWTELFYIERRSSETGLALFGLSVLIVFLVLAALYESWMLPLAVILVVPTCVSCSLLGVWIAKQDVNLFTQVGFVVLIGLACKNAILIVEYAKWQREAGDDRRTAILKACQLRLRPILMTSIAFILGVLPLVLATGAGAEMRVALGTAVFSGMLGVTIFGIFLTPVFYVLLDWYTQTPIRTRLGNVLRMSWYLVSLKFLRSLWQKK